MRHYLIPPVSISKKTPKYNHIELTPEAIPAIKNLQESGNIGNRPRQIYKIGS
jgi:hypothetical protein